MKRFLLPLMCLFVLFLASGSASADTNCAFNRSGGLDFGNLDPGLGGSFNETMQIDANCQSYVVIDFVGIFSQPIRACMSLDAGSGGGDTNWRYMVDRNNKKIKYQLYGAANHVNPYRAGTAVANDMRLEFRFISLFTWVPSTSNFKIYGWIPETTGLEEGVYTDTVQATFRYDESGGWFFPSGCSFSGGKTATTTLQVRVHVKSFCTLDVSQHIDFGNWQELDQPRDQQGAVTVHCDASTKYAVKLGWGGQGDVNKTRNMANGNEKISYNLYRDDKRSQPWGDNATTGFLKDQQGEGKKKVIPIYARVPKQATPSPGTYADNVVVTLEYN
ncbi:Csu type fimbrial protein [Phyllobacterium bourgognense]|uniref:Spore coat protein U-like protein n=1 Tax=Phyllobacterium bourgognense TaxID=314236 RepID=A0A368Z1Y7_9HYPH|nr:spore coat protein U domain-containing protein [Phyllobacterium bourgognense]RCW86465.1 spore coat protein U-like protein [Phyllobacterium bourgognense]